ncbi:hypothetical protein NQ317_013666 [Molorchus minor]|uniref:Uncharacterized protein n=1 Tax=Molorchus minor TaxID=1323400 RepID=A0ABQ9IYT1_9CUCU|nr:hypothetical protein NQ317_013666 [Molorchus minor]
MGPKMLVKQRFTCVTDQPPLIQQNKILTILGNLTLLKQSSLGFTIRGVVWAENILSPPNGATFGVQTSFCNPEQILLENLNFGIVIYTLKI